MIGDRTIAVQSHGSKSHARVKKQPEVGKNTTVDDVEIVFAIAIQSHNKKNTTVDNVKIVFDPEKRNFFTEKREGSTRIFFLKFSTDFIIIIKWCDKSISIKKKEYFTNE